MRRVLYVNWVDYLDAERRGGGVSVYQRNLMEEMGARAEVEAVFLAAGISHDIRRRAPRWERMRHGPRQDRDRRYEIVNSGVLAPGHHSFGDPAQVDHPATATAFFDFLRATGPYDAVHFNNLEGLPVSVLGLRAVAPGTRVIVMLHNYYPICPQVNLWRRERESCVDFEGGRACADCLPQRPDARLVRLANGVAYRLKCLGLAPGGRGFDPLFRWGMRAVRLLRRGLPARRAAAVPARAAAQHFATRRAAMVAALNRDCDAVLCVSEAVRRLAVGYGLAPARAHVCRIGTREARTFARSAPRGPLPRGDGTLTLAYLGYMRADKGFFFLLDALEALPDALAARLRLMVAARGGNAAGMARLGALGALGARLAGVRHVDGYDHAGLDALLADVDLGVVPVLWHDNLPQVAIEMHARRIPLLCADIGGARELGNCAEMVFAAGDVADFGARIAAILEGRIDLDAYWRGARAPVTMARHADDLARHYGWE